MDAAQDHGHAPLAELIGNRVRAGNFGSESGDPDQVDRPVVIDGFDAGIMDDHLPARGCERGQGGQAQLDEPRFAMAHFSPMSPFAARQN